MIKLWKADDGTYDLAIALEPWRSGTAIFYQYDPESWMLRLESREVGQLLGGN